MRVYNTDLHTFPGVIWAGTLYKAEKPMQPFEATSEAQAAPKVSFAPAAPPVAPEGAPKTAP